MYADHDKNETINNLRRNETGHSETNAQPSVSGKGHANQTEPCSSGVDAQQQSERAPNKPFPRETEGDHSTESHRQRPQSEPDQRNSEKDQKSQGGATGPRTDAGKARSARNAIKFGEYFDGTFPDEEKEARQYSKALRLRIPPQNKLAEKEISRMVINRLRRDRVDLHFEIQIELERLSNFKSRTWEEFDLIGKSVDQRHSGASLSGLGPTAHAARVGCLRGLKEEIESRGLEPAKDLPLIDSIYGQHKTPLVTHIILFYEKIESHKEPSPAQAELQCKILDFLDLEINYQLQELDDASARLKLELRAALYAPSSDSLWERYSKLSSALDREFDQALQRVKRLNGSDKEPD
jgi:hypothetical protein